MANEAGKAKSPLSRRNPSSVSNTRRLISQLGEQNGELVEEARQSLVEIGPPAIAPLIEALSDANPQIRFEAAKTLGQIGDPAAIPDLLKAMEDIEFEVRWLAAEALVNIGEPAVVPLLKELVKRADKVWFLQGAHHIINHVAGGDRNVEHHIFEHPWLKTFTLREALLPVLAALDGPHPQAEVPLAARMALDKISAIEHKK